MERARIVLKNGSRELEIEGAEEFVKGTLTALQDLLFPQKDELTEEVGPDTMESLTGSNGDGRADGNGKPQSLERFFKEKQPQNSSEAIACALYFLSKFRGKVEASPDDIRKALLGGKYAPGNIRKGIENCRSRTTYIEAGSEKGSSRLTDDGEAAVELELPRQK